MAQGLVAKAEQAIDHALSAARNFRDDAGNLIERSQDEVTISARENPYTTLIAAIVVGFLVGAVWKS